MVIFAAFVFVLSLALMAGLFALKIRETKTGVYPLAEWREVADAEAHKLKELALAADLDIKKLPPLFMYWVHVALHAAALEFAHLAREASRQAHKLADFVSHKRNFERRQTRSEFLKKMSELKQGNGQEGEENVEF